MSGATIHRTGTIEPEGEAPAVRRVRLRRNKPSFRVELTPLIDVIFLLLTFFIYAMVLMDRIELVPLDSPPWVHSPTITATRDHTITSKSLEELILCPSRSLSGAACGSRSSLWWRREPLRLVAPLR